MPLKLPVLIACAAVACVLLAGCGQTGALYLPDEGVTTPVTIRPSQTPAPASEPATAPGQAPAEEKQDDSKADAKPPAQG